MRVAVIGLGQMGLAYAQRLLEAGHQVAGFDLSATALRAMEESGGDSMASVEDAAESGTLVLLSLPDATVAERVVQQLVSRSTAARGVVDLSTSGVQGAQRLAGILSGAGVPYAEAPVTGGVAGARAGRLTLIAAGDQELLGAAAHVLSDLGQVVNVGPTAGHGQAIKVLNNLLSATNLAITSEVVAAGAALGLEPEQMLAVFNAGSGRNTATADKFPKHVLTGSFDQGFAAGLMRKDVGLAQDLLHEVGLPAFVSAAVAETWKAACRALSPDADFTEIARLSASYLFPNADPTSIYQE